MASPLHKNATKDTPMKILLIMINKLMTTVNGGYLRNTVYEYTQKATHELCVVLLLDEVQPTAAFHGIIPGIIRQKFFHPFQLL